eukprot:TRINITY_DN336_c0_g1_i1.p1 TRINITY_DN336_c0_g1~~TRINITY_DN336_c0_g1_i1.p1  ORF type:complete len:765 (+),score=107.44 TRINITY_DN336_c0_g1_i1:2788-5082(+)
MSKVLKLRVCSWNVGNAQPPADLKKWLGVEDDGGEYDIIVVGAQEANLKHDKSQSPTSVANIDHSSQKSSPGPVPLARQGSRSLPSIPQRGKRFTKFAKAIKVAKTTIRDGSTKKTKLKARSADSEDSYWGKYIIPEDKTAEERSRGIPYSSSSFPRRKERDDSEFSKGFSEEVPSLTFSQFMKSDFADLDESLVRKTRSPRPSESSICQNHCFDSSSDETASEGSYESEAESCGGREIETMDFSDLICSKENYDKPKRLRSQMTSLLRIDEDGIGEKKFSRIVEKNMPESYKLVAKHHLMEIKLLLFVHETHVNRIVKIDSLVEATGIGNVIGNKGAVAVKLTLYDTTFWFVSSHLAAHEGTKFLNQRNTDVADIMRKIERRSGYNVPLIHQVNHVFWLGDLNYRLDLPYLLPVALTWDHERKLAYVLRKISERQYEDLSLFDELRREMQRATVFGGFTEGKIEFAPTFKVVRGQRSTMYQPNRVPGYCDRILWHSLPIHRNQIRLRAYDSVPEIDTSDHKPVYAWFEVVVQMPIRFLQFPLKEIAVRCTLDFLLIQVEGLYEKRMEMEESDIQYEVLEDGALAVSAHMDCTPRTTPTKGNGGNGAHTRQVVTASFHGHGAFIKRKPYLVEIPLRQGRREALYHELPTIPLRPVEGVTSFSFKFITIVFTRPRSRNGCSCVLPLSKMLEKPGLHRADVELDLIKNCAVIAKVRVMAELVPSATDWVDAQNRPTLFKKKMQTLRGDGTPGASRANSPSATINRK